MKKPFCRILYVQVLAAIVIDVLLGHYSPELAVEMKPLGDGSIQLIKIMIGPIIFCIIVSDIAGMCDMKKAGHVGGKALPYFEVILTFVLIIGLTAGHIFNPGAGLNVDVNTINAKAVAQYAVKAYSTSTVSFLLNIIPSTVVDTFTKGDILQILLIAPLFGGALSAMGERAQVVTDFIGQVSHVFSRIIHVIARVAPIGAFDTMAFTIGRYGVISLVPLFKLVGVFYFTTIVFVVVVLSTIAQVIGLNIFRFVVYTKEELLTVLGISSSESALSHLMEKIKRLGCSKSVADLMIPADYSFNLNGTNIYMTITVIFISQALNIELAWTRQLAILAVVTLTSKGTSGIASAGFIMLAVMLAVVPDIPVADMVPILGIDRFMSERRTLTNITGNGVACVVISTQERELGRARLARVLPGDRSNEGMPATPAV